jgi:23S rRNA G2445 N2-methylase RlmL
VVPALLLRHTKEIGGRTLFLAEYPIKVNLKSETPTDDGSRRYLRQSIIRYRFKQRFSFVLEEMGCRVDCTVVQQADNVPVSELLRSVKRFEIEVEVVDRDMKTDDAVSSF